MGSFVAFWSLPLLQASLPTPLQEAVLLSCSPFPSPSPLFIPAPSPPPRRLACLLSASSSPRTPGLTTGRTHDCQQAGCGQFVDSSGKGLSHQCEKYFGAVNPQPGWPSLPLAGARWAPGSLPPCPGGYQDLPRRGGQCLLTSHLPSSTLAQYVSAPPYAKTNHGLPLW